MANKKAPKRLADPPTRIVGRLSANQRSEHARVMSLADVSARTGIDRGNVSKLEQNADNVELNTLVRLADALGYDVVVDIKKRPLPASP